MQKKAVLLPEELERDCVTKILYSHQAIILGFIRPRDQEGDLGTVLDRSGSQ
jgi:hypothetical protein